MMGARSQAENNSNPNKKPGRRSSFKELFKITKRSADNKKKKFD